MFVQRRSRIRSAKERSAPTNQLLTPVVCGKAPLLFRVDATITREVADSLVLHASLAIGERVKTDPLAIPENGLLGDGREAGAP
jgi:hypothetical protein